MRIALLTISALGLLLCGGCGKEQLVLPGDDAVVYTITCDKTPEDCHVGARTLCNGPYEPAAAPAGKKAAGSYGWVDSAGEQQDAGSGGGRYSLRVRCK